jgi:hypothetical protein|nr:MAG TPA: hypothetical protein [Caudoviricetes sp.]
MSRELTYTDIAGYLANPLFGSHPSGAVCWIDLDFVSKHGIGLANYRPVLRPMSDLYKEIRDKDYNAGKPFIPLVELAKVRHPDYSSYVFDAQEQLVYVSSDGLSDFYDYFSDQLSYEEFDLLHRLKFDYRGLIDEGLAVSVYDLGSDPYI